MGKSQNSLPSASHYTANYGNFQRTCTRRSVVKLLGGYWTKQLLTSDEQDKFLEWLELSPGKCLLDTVWELEARHCGSPLHRLFIVGIDVHEQALRRSSLAAQRGWRARRVSVQMLPQPMPFSDAVRRHHLH